MKSLHAVITKLTGYLILFLFFDNDLKAQTAAKGKFKAAVVKINITPHDSQYLLGYKERKSTGVHDSIYEKVLVMDDGLTQFILISSDICLFSPVEYEHLAKNVKNKYGIEKTQIWWTVTHTHSAPELGGEGIKLISGRDNHVRDTNYTAIVEKKLMEGIAEARMKLEPARLGAGWGFSQANINRRAIDINGTASLGLNPDGPVDRRIGLLKIDRVNGKPLAIIANYPIHGTVLGENSNEISGDVPGIVAAYVEGKTGAPVLFINGAAGNLAPIYSVYDNPEIGHLNQFCVLLGDKILDAYHKIQMTTDDINLKTGQMIVEAPKRADLMWPDYLNNYISVKKTGPSMVRLPVSFLKINDDIAIWSTPLELFCELSNEIRDNSPFPYTFYFGYSNGWLGYLPSESEWQHGGYETSVTPFTPEADKLLIESVIGYLKGELKSK
ncbi:MAG: neutral/alkaline non-lysosomal ceramidase N-terminal domain-containing protein [Flavisolibacter sp.]